MKVTLVGNGKKIESLLYNFWIKFGNSGHSGKANSFVG
jgi:hypothetical protein